MKLLNRFFFLVVLVAVLTGCKKSEIDAWLSNVNKLKVNAEETTERFSFNEEEQKIFKAYYAELQEKVAEIQDDPKLQKEFNKILSKENLDTLCSKILTKHTSWSTLKAHCQSGGFFLCSDSVASYPETLKAMRALLTSDLQVKFDKAANCKAALE